MNKQQSIAEFLVQYMETADATLTRPLFDVNMRLFRSNKQYRRLIHQVVQYMVSVLRQEFSDYAHLKGISGANLGIPWNIIAYKSADSVVVMLNPEITPASPETVTVKSNCGSLRLFRAVEVPRHKTIDCTWFDLEGSKKHLQDIDSAHGGFTIQHEVAHNQGILVTVQGTR